MKTLKCDLCEHEAQGETFEEWMEALKSHYFEAHADVMKDSSKTKRIWESGWLKIRQGLTLPKANNVFMRIRLYLRAIEDF